ncbi:protein kinase family protein [Nocardia shimofusensis]|uniref:protein kinase family protein n=1 Tax=Nocardia shimofusensis TaxID=228596 RepID=UPI001FDF2054|nr:protein kinase family protein [Nocardia shimofusensis]
MSSTCAETRLAAYGSISTSLAMLSDRALQQTLDAAEPVGSGIGGESVLLEVAGRQVFVKRVPLTDLELRPENVHSTANLFELPMFCHYGIGSPGFGAWRELAAHVMTTNWALAGEFAGFPLMYHWRVLPDTTPLPQELADIERVVDFWEGGAQVRRRLEERHSSSASIALFLEHIPRNLFSWLGEQLRAGSEAADRALAMVDRDLAAGIAFMNTNGLLHFDAHFQNLLTDGERLYVADYGLAISCRFELAEDELAFFERHRNYDRCYASMYTAQWLVAELFGPGRDQRESRLRAYASGQVPLGIPKTAAAILTRDAPVAVAMTDFFNLLRYETRRAPYPAGL